MIGRCLRLLCFGMSVSLGLPSGPALAAPDETITQITAFEAAQAAGNIEDAARTAALLSEADLSDAPLSRLEIRSFRTSLALALAANDQVDEAITLLTRLIEADKAALDGAGADEASAIRLGLADRLQALAQVRLQRCGPENAVGRVGCNPQAALAALDEARGVELALYGEDSPQRRYLLADIIDIQQRFNQTVDPDDQVTLDRLAAIADAESRALLSLGRPSDLPQTDEYHTVRVFFGTNREATGAVNPENAYNRKRSNLSYGSVVVTVPKERALGSIPRPAIWDLRGARDGVHIVLKRIEKDDGVDDFTVRLRKSLAYGADEKKTDTTEAFIFIHGHGTTLANAARQTAQLAVDLDMRHGGIFYSWPSGGMLGYQNSQNNVAPSIPHLKTFLMQIADRSGADQIHIMAHSMGNRLLLAALEDIADDRSTRDQRLFSEIIWAAPDIDAEVFAGRITEVQEANIAQRMTLYSSRSDRALGISRWLADDYPRAGQSPPLPEIASRVETIDTSPVSQGPLGHFDFTTGAINDMRAIVWLSLETGQRCPLVSRALEETIEYWSVDRGRPGCREREFRRAISAIRLYGRDSVVEQIEAFIEKLETIDRNFRDARSWRQALAIVNELLER